MPSVQTKLPTARERERSRRRTVRGSENCEPSQSTSRSSWMHTAAETNGLRAQPSARRSALRQKTASGTEGELRALKEVVETEGRAKDKLMEMLTARVTRAETRADNTEREKARLERELVSLRKEIRELRSNGTDTESMVSKLRSDLEQTRDELCRERKDGSQAQRQLLQLAGELEETRAVKESMERRSSSSRAEKQRAAAEGATLREQMDSLRKNLECESEWRRESEDRTRLLEEERDELRAQCDAVSEELATQRVEATDAADAARKENAALRDRVRQLEEGMGRTVKRLSNEEAHRATVQRRAAIQQQKLRVAGEQEKRVARENCNVEGRLSRLQAQLKQANRKTDFLQEKAKRLSDELDEQRRITQTVRENAVAQAALHNTLKQRFEYLEYVHSQCPTNGSNAQPPQPPSRTPCSRGTLRGTSQSSTRRCEGRSRSGVSRGKGIARNDSASSGRSNGNLSTRRSASDAASLNRDLSHGTNRVPDAAKLEGSDAPAWLRF